MDHKNLTQLEELHVQHHLTKHFAEQEVLLPFDYNTLDTDDAAYVRAIADRVREKDQQARGNVIDIGRDLIVVKEKLDHGQFGPWLRAEFQWDERTAQRYMGLAEHFGDKSDIVSLLPETV